MTIQSWARLMSNLTMVMFCTEPPGIGLRQRGPLRKKTISEAYNQPLNHPVLLNCFKY